ncbi:MAG: thiamine phosphate synthase, partial [Alphaproteobacteria bacterium]|nr:thiamine phosphate synthase [Alphaproteobacteria bacterium]
MLPAPPVMLITDAAQAVLPMDEIITQSLDAGCRWILLRDLNADDDDELLAQATRIKKICAPFDAKYFISRNMNVAKKIGADGIHLSSSQSMLEARQVCEGMVLGQSCHSLTDILAAEKNGADYVTLSPIFETVSKPGYGPALGMTTIENARKQTRLPIIALGG